MMMFNVVRALFTFAFSAIKNGAYTHPAARQEEKNHHFTRFSDAALAHDHALRWAYRPPAPARARLFTPSPFSHFNHFSSLCGRMMHALCAADVGLQTLE